MRVHTIALPSVNQMSFSHKSQVTKVFDFCSKSDNLPKYFHVCEFSSLF